MHRQRSPVRERNVNDIHQTRAAAEQFLRTLPPLHARRQLERQDAQHRSPGVLSALDRPRALYGGWSNPKAILYGEFASGKNLWALEIKTDS